MDFRNWGHRGLVAARQLARIPIIISCFGVALLASIATGSVTPAILLALIVIVLLIIHGNGTNDLADYEIDKVNLKGSHDRPLVSGDVSRRQLWWVQAVAGLLAFGLSWLLGTPAMIVTLAVALYNYAYSFRPLRITDRTILSPLTLAAAYTFQPFTLGYAAAGHAMAYPWLLALAIYFGFLARLLLKDFRDVKGDAKFGKQTFLLKYGSVVTCVASGVSALASLGFATAAVGLSAGAVIVLVIGNGSVLWLLTRLAKESALKRQLQYISLIAKLANTSLLALLVYYVCIGAAPDQTVLAIMLPLVSGLLLFTVIYRAGNRVVRH